MLPMGTSSEIGNNTIISSNEEIPKNLEICIVDASKEEAKSFERKFCMLIEINKISQEITNDEETDKENLEKLKESNNEISEILECIHSFLKNVSVLCDFQYFSTIDFPLFEFNKGLIRFSQ